MTIKVLTELRRAMHEQSENFNKGKKFKKYQTEIIELKNNRTEKSKGGIQQQTRWNRGKEQQTRRQGDRAVEFI